eukprot:CAMPEP_0178713056 /NCGR_PEP_ID=MMETSP0699-20121125/19212_1 /TAXON_ID=265572 /ORGANISM="Extubocellulus spinifer, Strain CCMP396" /LENGTH=47 /DNA_ID= /DNA_START= /DNA_END= /DNA_ORIENTATION=
MVAFKRSDVQSDWSAGSIGTVRMPKQAAKCSASLCAAGDVSVRTGVV